jgi:hypothetical protein
MYVINKTTSLINRINKLNKLNKNAAISTTNIAYIIYMYIYIYIIKKNKMAQVKKCNFKHRCIHVSRCPKMPSAVMNNSSGYKMPIWP